MGKHVCMLKFSRGHIKWLSLIIFGTLLDQVSKYFILQNFSYAESMKLFPGLQLTLSYNPGIAFGWFNSGELMAKIALLLITAAITIALMVWLIKTPKEHVFQAWGLGLIIGGAIGNFIDRLTRGYVVDFIDFYVKDWHFHTFNIADSFISVGAGLLILSAFIYKESS